MTDLQIISELTEWELREGNGFTSYLWSHGDVCKHYRPTEFDGDMLAALAHIRRKHNLYLRIDIDCDSAHSVAYYSADETKSFVDVEGSTFIAAGRAAILALHNELNE